MSKILLTIAGFDPTSGAGVLLDLKAFHRLGFEGAAVLTALTAQNTQGVDGVFSLPPDQISAQYQSLIRDITPAGIKIGMIGRKDGLPLIRRILDRHPDIPRVLDPVLRSTSGTPLLEAGGVSDLVTLFGGRVSLFTPNRDDAALLSRCPVDTPEDMKRAAVRIHDRIGSPCLIKGGHLAGTAPDVLFDGREIHVFPGTKIEKSVHGTGCYLSSIILGYLVMGKDLAEACRLAKRRTREAIRSALFPGSGQAVIPFARPLRT